MAGRARPLAPCRLRRAHTGIPDPRRRRRDRAWHGPDQAGIAGRDVRRSAHRAPGVDRVPHDPDPRPHLRRRRPVPGGDRRESGHLPRLLRRCRRLRRDVHPMGRRGHRVRLPGLRARRPARPGPRRALLAPGCGSSAERHGVRQSGTPASQALPADRSPRLPQDGFRTEFHSAPACGDGPGGRRPRPDGHRRAGAGQRHPRPGGVDRGAQRLRSSADAGPRDDPPAPRRRSEGAVRAFRRRLQRGPGRVLPYFGSGRVHRQAQHGGSPAPRTRIGSPGHHQPARPRDRRDRPDPGPEPGDAERDQHRRALRRIAAPAPLRRLQKPSQAQVGTVRESSRARAGTDWEPSQAARIRGPSGG